MAWDGQNVTVTYTLTSASTLEAVQVYAPDERPTTLAPGPYGDVNAPGGTTHTVTLPLADTNGKEGVWLILPGVVSCTR